MVLALLFWLIFAMSSAGIILNVLEFLNFPQEVISIVAGVILVIALIIVLVIVLYLGYFLQIQFVYGVFICYNYFNKDR